MDAERERIAASAGGLQDVTADRTRRAAAASARRQSASERIRAATDREAAAADRHEAAGDRRYAGLDELTGVFRRGTGELALTHEMHRARRSGQPLVLAVIDVDGLKAVNDRYGHAAGDGLLRDVATAIVATLRAYDVTVRWGGDEFVCALSDVTLEVAAERLADIRCALQASRPDASFSAGLALLAQGDDLDALISRADVALYEDKRARRR